MAHVAKYTMSTLGHMLNHYARQENDRVKRGNQEIKPELTHNNWNVARNLQPLSQMEFIHQRLSQVKVQKRADVNIMCDWVITLPKDVPENRKQEFFQQSFKFLCGRYGKENVVSAWVHEDETTPHMHFSFIPVTQNKKKGGFKVSANEVLTRKDLQTFHFDLQKHLETALSIPVGVLNQATIDGNQTVAELKRQTVVKKIDDAEKQLEQVQKDVKTTHQELESLKVELDEYRELEVSANAFVVEKKKVPFSRKVTVAFEDIEQLEEQAKAYRVNRQEVDTLRTRKTTLDERQQFLDYWEQELCEERKQMIADELQLMKDKIRNQDVHRLLNESERREKSQKAQIASLNAQNGSLMGQITKKDKTIQELNEQLKTTLQIVRGAYESVTNIVKAVGMFKYDKDNGYGVELTEKQGRLIDAIAKYGAELAREDGYPDLAKTMDEKIGISQGIQDEIQELTKKISQKRGERKL